MNKQVKHIGELHQEHRAWAQELAFFQEEMSLLKTSLGEVAMINTDKELLAQVDHFENQFIIQQQLIGEMQHEIHLHEHTLKQMVEENPVASEHRLVADHPELRDKMQVFKKLYGERKNEFNQFLAKSM
jgi:vacuolar-type H+-ATPase subunit B/Vma2